MRGYTLPIEDVRSLHNSASRPLDESVPTEPVEQPTAVPEAAPADPGRTPPRDNNAVPGIPPRNWMKFRLPLRRDGESGVRLRPGRGERKSSSRRVWQEQVLVRCDLLDASCAAISHGDSKESETNAALESAAGLIGAARRAASHERLTERVTGAAIERAWGSVHAAEVVIVAASPRDHLSALYAWVEDEIAPYLEGGSFQRKALTQPPLQPGAHQISAASGLSLAAALNSAHAASSAQHIRVRSFRNIVWFSFLLLSAGAVMLALIAAGHPEVAPMCSQNTRICVSGTMPSGMDVFMVEALGAVAGMVTAVGSLPRIQGTSTPYSVPIALAALKVPTGALSAVLGILLLRVVAANALVGPSTEAALVAWAVVFGSAQHLVTRLADVQGQVVLSSVKSGTSGNSDRQS